MLMGKMLGVLVVALIAGLGLWLYLKRMQPPEEKVSIVQIADSAGAKMDLAAIGRAEASYFAQHGSYATLDELASSSVFPVRTERKGYVYSIDLSPSGFTATAHCQSAPGQTCQSFTVDQSLEVRPVP
jgi:hypothetical protein